MLEVPHKIDREQLGVKGVKIDMVVEGFQLTTMGVLR
jgi:hypothetical protein